MREYFETRQRDDGTSYVTLTDDRPEWLQEAVYEAHDDEAPNDWRYEHCHYIARLIDDGDTEPAEIAESLTDDDTYSLLQWLSGHIARYTYSDTYAEENGFDPDATLMDRIRLGQYECLFQMAGILVDAAEENSDTDGGDES
jgi:uncharacterized protein YhjY with autotransporter beta-barrel domain